MILLQGMMAAPIVFPLLFAVGFLVVYLPLLLFSFVAGTLNADHNRRVWPVVPARWLTRTSLLAGALLCAFLLYRLATVELIN